MAVNNPNITFLVPLRAFVEDKDFLAKNLTNWIWKQIGKGESGEEYAEDVSSYKIVLHVISNKPVNVPFTKVQCQKALKDVFPNARCLNVTEDYTQQKSKTALPVIDFQIYTK